MNEEKNKESTEMQKNFEIDPESIVENIKEPSLWANLVLVIIFLVLFSFIASFLWFITAVQVLFTLVTRKPNLNLVSFSKKLGTYLSQIISFVTYASEERPFPFNPFPESDEN